VSNTCDMLMIAIVYYYMIIQRVICKYNTGDSGLTTKIIHYGNNALKCYDLAH